MEKKDREKIKPLCIYVASRLSIHPYQKAFKQLKVKMRNSTVILGYIYNLRESLKAAAEIWKKGHYPYVPGYDFLLYLELDDPQPRLPYEAGLEWVRRCDAILILNGLEDSPGVQKEFKEAKKRHKIIFYNTEEIPEVAERILQPMKLQLEAVEEIINGVIKSCLPSETF